MNGDFSYSYKASSFGAPWEFQLAADGIKWSAGLRSGTLRYDKITRVRLSFRPVTMQNYRFQTEIWAADGLKLKIASTSWRSIVEQTRQDAAYSAFIVELHRRLAAEGSRARFSAGIPDPLYWIGLLVFVLVSLGLAALAVRGLQAGQWAGAALVGGFFALFVWQIGGYFRRNRPCDYRPERVPPIALP